MPGSRSSRYTSSSSGIISTSKKALKTLKNTFLGIHYTIVKGNSFGRVFTVISLIIEYIQLLSWTFPRAIEVLSGDKTTASVFAVIQTPTQSISLDYNTFIAIFWVVCCLILLGLCNAVYVGYSFQTHGSVPMIFLLKTLRWIVASFVTVLFIPIVYVLLEILACDYTDQGAYLHNFPTVMCWQGTNLTPSIVSIIFLIAFILFSLSNSLIFFETDHSVQKTIGRPHGRFDTFVIMGKLAIAFTAELASRYDWAVAIVTLLFTSLLFTVHFFLLPTYSRGFNMFRSGVYLSVTWSSICQIGILAYNDGSSGARTFGILSIAGLLPMIFIGMFVSEVRFRYICNPDSIILPTLGISSSSSSPTSPLSPNQRIDPKRNGKKKVVAWHTDVESNLESHESIRKFAKRLLFPTDVCLSARFAYFSSQQKDPSTRRDLFEKAMLIYKIGLSKFPKSEMVLMAYTNFLILNSHNASQVSNTRTYHYQLATACLEKLRRTSNMYDIQFFVYSHLKDREQRVGKGGMGMDMGMGMGGGDFVQYMEYKKMYTQARKSHLNTLLLIRKFWRLLLDKGGIDLGKLSTLSGKIGESEKRALDSYEILLQQHGESPRIVRDYARFIEEVVQDPLLAQRLYSKADRLEEKETTAHSNAHSSRAKDSQPTDGDDTTQIKEEEGDHLKKSSDMNPENYYNQLINNLGFSSESILGTQEMEKAWNQSVEGGAEIKIDDDDESLSKSDDGTHYSEDSEASSSVLDVERNRAKLTAGQQNGPLRWLSWSMIITLLLSIGIALGSLIFMISSINNTKDMLDLLNGAGNLGQFALQIGVLSSYLQTQGYNTITTANFTTLPSGKTEITFRADSLASFNDMADQIIRASNTMLNIFESMYYGVNDRSAFYSQEFLLLEEQYGSPKPPLDIGAQPLPTTYFNKRPHLSGEIFNLMESPTLAPIVAINSPENASNPQSPLLVGLYTNNMGLWTLMHMFVSFVNDYAGINPQEIFALYVLSGGPSITASIQDALWEGVGDDMNSIYRSWRFILDNAPATIEDSMMLYGNFTIDQFTSENNTVVELVVVFFFVFTGVQIFLVIFLFRPVVIRIGQHKLTTLNLFVLIPRKVVKKLANKKISGITKNTEKSVNNRPTTTNEKIETEEESDRDDDSDKEDQGKPDIKLEDVKSENESDQNEGMDYPDEAGVNNLAESSASIQRESNLLSTSTLIPNPHVNINNINNGNNSNNLNSSTGNNNNSSLNATGEIAIDINPPNVPKLKKTEASKSKSKLSEITENVRLKISRSKMSQIQTISKEDGVGLDDMSPTSIDASEPNTPADPSHPHPHPHHHATVEGRIGETRFQSLWKWLRGSGNRISSEPNEAEKAKEDNKLSKVRYSKSLIAINRGLHLRYGVMMFLIFTVFLAWACVGVFGFLKFQNVGQTLVGHQNCMTLVRKIQFYGSMITGGIYRGDEMSGIVSELGDALTDLNSDFLTARALTEQLGYQAEFASNKFYKLYVSNMYSDPCAEHVISEMATNCRNSSDERYYDITSQGLSFMMLNFIELTATFLQTSLSALATLTATNQTVANMLPLIETTDLDYQMMIELGDTDLYYSLEYSSFVVYKLWQTELQKLQTSLGVVAAVQCIVIIALYFFLFRPFFNKLKNESAHSYVMLRLIPKEQIEKIPEIKKFLNAGVLKEEEDVAV